MLQFSETRKIDRAERLGNAHAPKGQIHTQQARYYVGAHSDFTHSTRLGRGFHPYDPELRKIRKGDFRKMEEESKRTLYLKVRVSPEEMTAIKKKFENSGMSNLSEFVRAMIFEGYIVHINENELNEIHRIANNVANKINQIAHRANVTKKVYKEDIDEIKELGDKLWRPLMFLQTKIANLKR